MDKVVLITGITGQDGSYLTEYLLSNGYTVHGIIRRSSLPNTHRIDHLLNNPLLHLHYGDITDGNSMISILKDVSDKCQGRIEIYNLAAQSHVGVSFKSPINTAQIDAIGTTNMLDAIRVLNLIDRCRFYQASTSELYGKVQEVPQTEKTPFYPRSPYAVAKLYSFWIVKNYREAYNMYACNGILFNHTSPRRGEEFVGKKITKAVAKIHKGEQDVLYLGNINSKRDWGHAKDYTRGMHMMLQQDEPEDFVLSMNEFHSVREFVELAFKEIGIDIKWRGDGLNEEGYSGERTYVKIDPQFFRPAEVDELLGDSTHAREKIGWKPEYTFNEIVKEMVNYDLTFS